MSNYENKGEDLLNKEEKNQEQNEGYVIVHEKEIKFMNMNEFKKEKFEDDDDNSDYKKLLDIKKNNLIYEFSRLKTETDKKKIYI